MIGIGEAGNAYYPAHPLGTRPRLGIDVRRVRGGSGSGTGATTIHKLVLVSDVGRRSIRIRSTRRTRRCGVGLGHTLMEQLVLGADGRSSTWARSTPHPIHQRRAAAARVAPHRERRRSRPYGAKGAARAARSPSRRPSGRPSTSRRVSIRDLPITPSGSGRDDAESIERARVTSVRHRFQTAPLPFAQSRRDAKIF